MALDLSEIASNIERGPDGLWSARTDSRVSYPEAGNEICFAVEDCSFWFQHRNQCILEVIKSFPPPGPFFDVGGGNGYVASALQQAGLEVILVEPGPIGARNAIGRGVRQVVRATLQNVGFQPQSLPAVGLFDVVEHIEDDRAFLEKIHALLRPNGRVYITVPAMQWLWSEEDVRAGHWRRYTLTRLSQVLDAAGYVVEFATYFFAFLPLPILLRRVLPYRLGLARGNETEEQVPRADHNPGNRYVKQVLQMLTARELSKIRSGQRVRLGTSCLAVARKSKPGEDP